MQQRELGKSGLHISTIGPGSWAIAARLDESLAAL
jgi:aryl-alcohol dehydrogenase-like predicted oxidoreductase